MTNYSLLSFILRGERRKAILMCLDKPMIPKEIANRCNVSIHNVSKSLKELVDRGLIVCKNPNDKFYRFYELTKKGKDILKELDKTTK
ncbi:MAG: MarR family transcriptional regulator [archaeon]